MNTVIDAIVAPLAYPFMIRGLLAALTVGIVCTTLGSFIILRGMTFLGDALAHAILPGVAIGYLLSAGARGPLFWWGLGTGVLTSLSIGAITEQGQVKEDTAIGVIFAGMFALGVALISSVRSYSVDLSHFLFGDVLAVGPSDLLRTLIFGILVLAVLLGFYKEFLVLSFDPILAATLRIPTRFFHYLLMVLLAVSIVISLQTVGVGLMVAMLVTPAATASLLTRRLPAMMAVGACLGAFSAISGLYISYYANIASGASIVLVSTALFTLAYVFAPRKGLFWKGPLGRYVGRRT
jgi:manganese/iron transport system permease protein